MVDSVFVNSGRGCINCSGIWLAPHEGDPEAIAEPIGPVERCRRKTQVGGWRRSRVPGQADAVWPTRARPEGAGTHDMTGKFPRA